MNKKGFFVLLIILLLNFNFVYSSEETINQHTTEVVRDALNRINTHTDEKVTEQTQKGDELIIKAQKEIETATRNAAIKIFIASASAIIFAGTIVLIFMNVMWKKYTEILPLCDMDTKREQARLWVKDQFKKGYGQWNIRAQLRKSKYDSKTIKLIMAEVK